MRFFIVLLLSIWSIKSFSQEHKQTFISCSYNYQIPLGKLADRFGNNSSVGFSFLREKENNLFYGIESNYLFGNNVKGSTTVSWI